MTKQLAMPLNSGPQAERIEMVDNLSTTTWYDVRKEIFGDIFNITPLMDIMNSKGKIKSRMPKGRYFEIPIRFAKTKQNQKWFGRGDTFGTDEKEFLTVMQFAAKNFGDSMVRYWDDERQNKSPAAIFNFVETMIEGHKEGMGETLAEALWTRSDAKALTPLPELISTTPAVGTIGGLDRDKIEYVQNQAVNFGTAYGAIGTDLVPAMTTMYNNCSKKKGKGRRSPDCIVTTQAIYEEYEDQVRAMGSYEMNSNTKRADLGMGDMMFKGAEMTWDPECPEGQMYFLNTDTMEFAYDPDAWMEMTEWKPVHNTLDRHAQTVTSCELLFTNFQKNGVMFGIA